LLAAGAAKAEETQAPSFRAVHYEVRASLDPADQSLAARAQVEFEARSASRTVEVELNPGLRVRSVSGSDGKPLDYERTSEGTILRVTLPQTVAQGDKVALRFEYDGRLAGEEPSSGKSSLPARIAPQGSYLLLPARWFPLTNYLTNRYTATFEIEVPEKLSVVGTGKPYGPVPAAPNPAVSRPAEKAQHPGKAQPAPPPPASPAGPRVVYTFQVQQPEAAGTFVVGNFQVVPTRAEGLEVPVYIGSGPTNTAAAYGESVAKIVNYFSAEFGPLPQRNFTVVQLPNTSAPDYAAPGLLLVSPRQWEPRVNYRLLARLLGEQWWGGAVQPASASDVWLSDGLARYSEALYVQSVAGTEGFNRELEEFAIGALMYEDAAPIAQASRLEPFSSEYRSVVVNKGAMVFHMLRNMLGEDNFAALLRDFYSKYAGKSARLEEFEKLAQEPARGSGKQPGVNLGPFFAQWLNSTGVPEFKMEYVIYRTQKGFKVVGKVKQDLDTFRMPVELKIDTEGNPELKTIEVIGSNSEFVVETFGRPKPNGVTLDPHHNLLKSSPRLRVRAAIARGEELAAAGQYYEAIQQYERALAVDRNNPLAEFRMGEAMFYQKNLQAAANAFRDAEMGNPDPSYKWVAVWSHIYLGKIFDLTGQRERAVNEYQKAIETNDDTGGAQAEAQRYLNEPYKEEARPGSD
jgi:aminopeptidase N